MENEVQGNNPAPSNPPQSVNIPAAMPPEKPKTSGRKTAKKVVFGILGVLAIVILVGVLGIFALNKTSDNKTVQKETGVIKPINNNVDDENTVTVWAWNTAAKSLALLVPEFNKVYPGIKVKVVEIPYNEANGKFETASATGVGLPDVMDVEGPVTLGYIKKGALLDITYKANVYKDDFVAYKWGEVSLDGKIYALPWDTAPAGLFYRRDLFNEAGVDPDTILTWDDYITAGKKITKDKNGDGKPDQYMTLMSTNADVQDWFQLLLSEYGKNEFDEKGNPSFNTPEGVAVVKLMKKMLEAGITVNVGWWSPEMFEGIKSGQIASLTQGVWMGGQIKDTAPGTSGKWGVVALPAITPGGVRTAVRGGSNLAIAAGANNKEEAWKFIEFALTRKESQLNMYNSYNIFPALKEAYNDPVFNKEDPFFGNQKTSPLFIEIQFRLPSTFHYGIHQIEANNIISSEIVLALNGKKTPEQALKDAEAKVLEIIKID